MKRKRPEPVKDLMGASLGIGGAAIGIGAGSSLVEGTGGSAAPLATFGKVLKPTARVVGGSIMINTLLNLKEDTEMQLKGKKPKRRRWI